MKNFLWGFALVVFGTLLLLDNLGIADMSTVIHNFWPLILILIGLGVLRRHGKMPASPSSTPYPPSAAYPGNPVPPPRPSIDADYLQQSSVFGDTEIAVKSQTFRGGSVSSVFGDTHIDLTNITIAEGESTLRIHTVFGDTRVLLPPIAAIAVTGNSTFGSAQVLGQRKEGVSSFVAGNTPEYATSPNRLKINITKVFGDLYVS